MKIQEDEIIIIPETNSHHLLESAAESEYFLITFIYKNIEDFTAKLSLPLNKPFSILFPTR